MMIINLSIFLIVTFIIYHLLNKITGDGKKVYVNMETNVIRGEYNGKVLCRRPFNFPKTSVEEMEQLKKEVEKELDELIIKYKQFKEL